MKPPVASPGRGIPGPVLEVRDLRVALPEGADREFAVDRVSLSIERGRTLCIVGESGSGKSVMASAVMGLLPKELRLAQGQLILEDEDLRAASPARWRTLRGKAVSMVFQEPMTALNPIMRCGAQIDELMRRHTDWPARQRKTRLIEILKSVKLPEPERIAASFPHQLSGGQRQRIVIAMAMVLKPHLLICDEPTTALDVTTQAEILKLIRELRELQGTAVLFITHDMGVVAQIADEVMVMYKGQVVEQGSCHAVLREPREAYTRKLLAAVPSMVPPPPRELPSKDVLLRAKGVGKTYVRTRLLGSAERTEALRDAALSVRRGETVGVIGESGSGKSTFARCLMRLIEPTAGEIHWAADAVQNLSERQLLRVRNRVQVVFQDPNRSLNPRLRVGESMIEGAVNLAGLTREQAWTKAEELMDCVQLPRQSLQRYPREFSGGQRQRLAIARALACQPQVLIADEAVSALDVSVQAQILQLLKKLQAELGLGMVFITHDLRVAAQLCDCAIVMHRGRIVESGPTAELYAQPREAYTRQLLAVAPHLDGVACAPA